MVGKKKIFFGTIYRMLEKHHPRKEIFQSMTLYNIHKSPLINVSFFVYHKPWLGCEIERNRQIDFG